jgi:hypothetical protein
LKVAHRHLIPTHPLRGAIDRRVEASVIPGDDLADELADDTLLGVATAAATVVIGDEPDPEGLRLGQNLRSDRRLHRGGGYRDGLR